VAAGDALSRSHEQLASILESPSRPVPAPLPAQAAQAPARGKRPACSIAAAAVLSLVLLAASYVLASYRTAQAIDVNSDEVSYSIISIGLRDTGVTRWDASPIFVHPPLFFLIEGRYFQWLGVGYSPVFQRIVAAPFDFGKALLPPDTPATDDNMLNSIIAGRYLVAVYVSLLTATVFVLAYALDGICLGLLSAVFMMIDPYMARRNHFNMLEPLTTLLGMLALLAYWQAIGRSGTRSRQLYLFTAGVLSGLALLAKELAIIYVLVIVVHAVWSRARMWRELLPVLTITGLLYLLFPAWAAINGDFAQWLSTRNWLFNRLTGTIRDTGVTRPNPGFTQTVSGSLLDYWPSFVVLGVAGCLALVFVWWRLRYRLDDRPGGFLAAFVLTTQAFFVSVALIGGVVNEQFVYLLMPGAIMLPLYTALAWPRLRRELMLCSETRGGAHHFFQPRPVRVARSVLLLLFACLVAFDVYAWANRYVLSRDDSFAQTDTFLDRALPAGTPIAGRDLVDTFLLPHLAVFSYSLAPDAIAATSIARQKIPFAILSEQFLAQRYGGANPAFYDFVQQTGSLFYVFNGRVWKTYVNQIDYSRPLHIPLNVDSIALNLPASASSTADPSTTAPALAFDGDGATHCQSSTGGEQWLAVDLGASTHVGRLELTWDSAYATSYDLQVSDDGQTWRTIVSNPSGQGEHEAFRVSANGRYVRLLMHQSIAPDAYGLAELGVYP
jgi:F5/8 type C domain/Dolichyl-phosphate-mannose-protein mannosyltransferase